MLTLSGVLAFALERARPLTPAFIAAGVVATVLAYRGSPRLRQSFDSITDRALVIGHAVRAPIGAAFLYEHANGLLPTTFALRAGWGDIAVGLAALVVASAAPYVSRQRRVLLATFSFVGLFDIALAVGTAQYALLIAQDPLMTAALGRFPYGLLPVFIVPLVVLAHVFVLYRLARDSRSLRVAET